MNHRENRFELEQEDEKLSVRINPSLPTPQQLKGYLDVSSDFPERILRMAENEQGNRHLEAMALIDLEKEKIKGVVKMNRRNAIQKIILSSLPILMIGWIFYVYKGSSIPWEGVIIMILCILPSGTLRNLVLKALKSKV